MHIFCSDYEIRTKDGTVFLPGVRYVVPSGLARDLEAGIIAQRGEDAVYRLSHLNSYENRYHGQKLFGDRLSIYRHGAIGDTLITTALVAELRHRNPDAQIDLYCRPGNADLWHGLGVNVRPGFPVFDEVRHDQHLFFENMLEADSEPDQGCAIDSMLRFAGINPESVPPEHKVPVVVEREDDGASPLAESYVLIHRNASNSNRTYPHMEQVGQELLKDRWVFTVGDSPLFGVTIETPRFRNLIPVVKNAALVICPDSSIGHLAAAFPSVPVISLWGLFHPNDRIKYYRNHHPLVGFAACPHAPCRSHEFKLPRKCKDAPGFDGISCAALASITPVQIVAKAKELLCQKSSS